MSLAFEYSEFTSEWAAWAYALNKSRPFIKGMGLKDDTVQELVHSYALAKYCTEKK